MKCPKCGAELVVERSIGVPMYVCENMRKREEPTSPEPLCDYFSPVLNEEDAIPEPA